MAMGGVAAAGWLYVAVQQNELGEPRVHEDLLGVKNGAICIFQEWTLIKNQRIKYD